MIIKPFRGFRPVPEKAKDVASRPYDVLDSDEAAAEAQGNPWSFLRVVKPEITLPADTDHYSPAVYAAGRNNFKALVDQGVFAQDQSDCLYIYELTMNGKSQTGIVGAAAVQDYLDGKIRKHELTRPDKEADRKNHVRVSGMNAEPVFFAYRADKGIDKRVEAIKQAPAAYDFDAVDGIRHRLWVVSDKADQQFLVDAFSAMPATYVADGHHRTAAAALVGADLKQENPAHTGQELYNYFLAVHFPDDQLTIMDYNRVVRDLNGHSPEEFRRKLEASFDVETKGAAPYRPEHLHEFSLYLDGCWYKLTARKGTYNDADPIGVLDVTILSEQILAPLLGIQDLRTDKRIDFIGGMRGLGELSRRVDNGEMKAAFALYPVSMKQLMDIADSGAIMPPKTTWFEPKLRSGLVVYAFGNV